jgi:hypothetical protein
MSALSNTVPPPPYFEVTQFQAPPAYSEQGDDLCAQLEQMKAAMEKMRLERDEMMWKMHLEKEAMMEKMEMMRLEKEALTKQGHSVSSQMRIQTEMKEFIAKEKHWSSDFNSWDKQSKHPAPVRSFVSSFLKTIPTETVYAIHSITLDDSGYAACPGDRPFQISRVNLYIATDSKVYTIELTGGLSYRDYQIPPTPIFRVIVTFPSEPNPTFWRAVFSQMGKEDILFTAWGQGNRGDAYSVSNAKLEALFKSFR